MRIFHVAPREYVGLANSSRFLVEGPWLLKDGLYASKMHKFTGEWILDHGLALKEGITIPEHEELCREFNPSFAVMPDTWKDAKKTLEDSRKFMSALKWEPDRFIYACQGKDVEEIIQSAVCAEQALGEDVHLAIPYKLLMASTAIECASLRMRVAIRMRSLFKNPIHLLGLWDWMEVAAGENIGINSCDSSLAYIMAAAGYNCQASRDIKYGYNDAVTLAKEINDEQLHERVLHNMHFLTHIAEGGKWDSDKYERYTKGGASAAEEAEKKEEVKA